MTADYNGWNDAPEAEREAIDDYTRQEFARDLYLLDQSGEIATRDGARLRWAASTGTRGSGVLTTVARSGQQQRYWGIAFTPPQGVDS